MENDEEIERNLRELGRDPLWGRVAEARIAAARDRAIDHIMRHVAVPDCVPVEWTAS